MSLSPGKGFIQAVFCFLEEETGNRMSSCPPLNKDDAKTPKPQLQLSERSGSILKNSSARMLKSYFHLWEGWYCWTTQRCFTSGALQTLISEATERVADSPRQSYYCSQSACYPADLLANFHLSPRPLSCCPPSPAGCLWWHLADKGSIKWKIPQLILFRCECQKWEILLRWCSVMFWTVENWNMSNGF